MHDPPINTPPRTCSRLSSTIRSVSGPSARPARTKAATALVVASVLGSLSSVHGSPLPFLDFLYPSLSSPTPRPISSSGSSESSRPSQSAPRRQPPSAIRKLESDPVDQTSHSQPRPKVERRRRRASTALVPRGLVVPIKFEPVDDGWVLADSWELHGRTRVADTLALENSTSGLDNIQNLDITDPFGGSIYETTSDLLQLPQGWNQSHLARHENYDPIIVTVFAVILVLSIMGTIGLCSWRARKLRRLRDVERQLRKERGEDDGDVDEATKKPKQGKKRKTTGKSTALRKVTARWRRKSRQKAALEGQEPQTTIPLPSDESTNPPEPRVADASPSPGQEAQGTSPERERDTTDDVSTRPRSPSVHHPSNTRPPSTFIQDSRPPSPTRNRPIHPNEDTEEPRVPASVLPSSEPPTYLATTSRRPTAVLGRSEKAPIRGREEEYDDRDIAAYRTRRSTALDPLPDSNVPHTPSPDPIPEPQREREEDDESAPPFVVLESTSGTSRVAAGTRRAAHVATDDKMVLERLRNMADEPARVEATIGVHPEVGDERVRSAVVPTWRDVDEWEAQQQIRDIGDDDVDDDHEGVGASRSAEIGPLPPPPSLTLSSPAALGDVERDYPLGSVWSAMALPLPPSSESGNRPSAPPDDDSNTSRVLLVPSAPPEMEEQAAVPSAPVWGEEDQEQPQASAPPLSSNPSTPARSDLHISPIEIPRDDLAVPRSDAILSRAAERDSMSLRQPPGEEREDSDGSESINSSSDGNGPRNGRWNEMRTSGREGRGLPKYEP